MSTKTMSGRDLDPLESLPSERMGGLTDSDVYEMTRGLMAEDSDLGEPDVLPDGLEDMAAGVFLAAMLASVDVSSLTGYDVVRYVQAQQRLVSHDNAGLYAGVAEMAYAYQPDTTARLDIPAEFASDELQTALVKTRRSADGDLDLALQLRDQLSDVWETLNEGRLDLARVRVFASELSTLNPDLIPGVVDRVLPAAEDLTTGQLRAGLKRAVLQVDPDSAQIQFEAGIEDRKTVVFSNPDHTGDFHIRNVDPAHLLTAHRHINHLATSLKRLPGETRSIDQLRADVAMGLLQGNTTDRTRPVQTKLVIHLKTDTIHFPGYGPVLPDTLTRLLQTAQNNNDVEIVDPTTITDTCTHQTSSRTPTPTQVKHITSAYATCIFPGCRISAADCDIDHRRQHAQDGPTACHNLAPLCRHHHRCKDETTWNLQRNPDQTHTWTSPLGHTYTTDPSP